MQTAKSATGDWRRIQHHSIAFEGPLVESPILAVNGDDDHAPGSALRKSDGIAATRCMKELYENSIPDHANPHIRSINDLSASMARARLVSADGFQHRPVLNVVSG
jgi:hypothetical protein